VSNSFFNSSSRFLQFFSRGLFFLKKRLVDYTDSVLCKNRSNIKLIDYCGLLDFARSDSMRCISSGMNAHVIPFVLRLTMGSSGVHVQTSRSLKLLFYSFNSLHYRREEEYGWTCGLSMTRSAGPGWGCSGPFRGSRGPGSGGVLASRASAGQRRLSAQGVEPGGRGSRAGVE
jgi:hypothetical protein